MSNQNTLVRFALILFAAAAVFQTPVPADAQSVIVASPENVPPLPTPTPKQCLIELNSPKDKDYGQSVVEWAKEWYDLVIQAPPNNERPIFTGDAAEHSCTGALIEEAYNDCIDDSDSWSSHSIPNSYSKEIICRKGSDGRSSVAGFEHEDQQYLDDRYLRSILFDVNNQERWDTLVEFDLKQEGDPNWYTNYLTFLADKGDWTDIFALKARYMDDSCNLIKDFDPDKYQVCSHLTVDFLLSPISLIWDDNTNIGDVISFSTFPIDPARRGSWIWWRASGKTPLLVYDPEHKGTVNSGFDLFGNWTFGGNAAAARTGSMTMPRPWRDGYEALASLDRNSDRKLSGEELEPIALWFDHNQDGVSQQGEVQPAVQAGITALHVTPDARDRDGNIHARAGYERSVGGRIERRRSVDWFAQSFATKLEAMQRWNAESALKNLPSAAGAPAAGGRAAVRTIDVEPGEDVTGIWVWSAKDNRTGKTVGQGFLELRQINNELSGYSIIEQRVESSGRLPGGKKIKSVVKAHRLIGARYLADNGAWHLAFVVGGENKTFTFSGASMSADGRLLKGSSMAQIAKAGHGQKREFARFNWQAKRI